MSKKIIIPGLVILVTIIIMGVIIIAPNFKNEITGTNEVIDNQDNLIHSVAQTLRVERDIDVYTKEASAIVIGKFIRKGEPQWNIDKTYIDTATYFLVSEVLNGDLKAGDEIKILQWGGELDGQIQVMDGAFIYNEDKDNLLYLGTDEDDNWGVFQGDWGQFIVDENGQVKNFDDKTVSLSDFKEEIIKRIE